MWAKVANIILRNRILFLIILGIATAFMGFHARNIQISYGMPNLLPETDSTYIIHKEFKERFEKKESPVVVFGIAEDPLSSIESFNAWYELGNTLKNITGIDTVISIARIQNLVRNKELKRFELRPLVEGKITEQAQLDSLKIIAHTLKFYEGILFSDSTKASIMAVTLNLEYFHSKKRGPLTEHILEKVEEFSSTHNKKIYVSGLPYIRTIITEMVKKELRMFVILALLITILILYIFFRSVKPVAISMTVVFLGVIWSLGSMVLFDFKISILTSLIPPLLIVIGVPNCIYLINKYHQEFKMHGNKARSLSRTIQKVGKATFMTNATTATGFVTFLFTDSEILQEFGIIASINIMALFFFSILLMPIVFSYIAPPESKLTKHLDNKRMSKIVESLINIIEFHRDKVYITTAGIVVMALVGISLMVTTGNIVDDLPSDHIVTTDLQFFEDNFGGVMPFEIAIDAKKPGYAVKDHTLKKIDQLQQLLGTYPQFSKPLSVVEGMKFIKQSFYGGDPAKYTIINNSEKPFFKPYFDNFTDESDAMSVFLDSTKQHARVSVQMADIGTKQMEALLLDIRPKVDSIFSPDKYNVALTGTSVAFLAGSNYLVKNLFTSLFIAIILISFIMALIFSSFKMILVSLTTNMIPLMLTAATMGYFGINIKPSTILVFSIAFGISVDDAIHYLAKFRQELTSNGWNIKRAVIVALRETGVSMIYTSIILFFGFSVFISSQFGGTLALGVLVSFTLLTAVLANLILMPSFLLTLDKAITIQSFKEPLLQIYDEEEDIDLDHLTIETHNKINKEDANDDIND